MRFWKKQQIPRGLKPALLFVLDGAAKAAPLQAELLKQACTPVPHHFPSLQFRITLPVFSSASLSRASVPHYLAGLQFRITLPVFSV
jgi:hypothetical protein